MYLLYNYAYARAQKKIMVLFESQASRQKYSSMESTIFIYGKKGGGTNVVQAYMLVHPPASSTNKIDNHDVTEILLKVTLNTITLICGGGTNIIILQ
jgi:hypothetical protein